MAAPSVFSDTMKSVSEMREEYRDMHRDDLVDECRHRSIPIDPNKKLTKMKLIKILIKDYKSRRSQNKKRNDSQKKKPRVNESAGKNKANGEIQKPKKKKQMKKKNMQKEMVRDDSRPQPQPQTDNEAKDSDEKIMENSQVPENMPAMAPSAYYRQHSNDTFNSHQTYVSSALCIGSLNSILDGDSEDEDNGDIGTSQKAKKNKFADDSISQPQPRNSTSRPRSDSDESQNFDEMKIDDALSPLSDTHARPFIDSCYGDHNDNAQTREIRVHPFLDPNDGITCRVCLQRSDRTHGCSIVRVQDAFVLDKLKQIYPYGEELEMSIAN